MSDTQCTWTRAECHHKGTKCSECGLADLICDEMQNSLDISYFQGARDIVATGRIASKNFLDGMLKMADEKLAEIPLTDSNARMELSLKTLALRDCHTMFNGIWDELDRQIKEQKNERMERMAAGREGWRQGTGRTVPENVRRRVPKGSSNGQGNG